MKRFNVYLSNIFYFLLRQLLALQWQSMLRFTRKYGLLLFTLLLLLLWIAERYWFVRRPILYPGFGIRIPAGYQVHGIDVSKYQKDIDWKLVSAMRDRGQKISFAIVKATEGCRTDRRFRKNWDAVEDEPIMRGAYLYFHAGQDGKRQADYFINHVPLAAGDLPPVVDIEERDRQSSETIRKNLKKCLSTLESRYHKKPIIYSNPSFYNRHLGETFDKYPLWIAHYEQCRKPCIQRNWVIWQHNDKGHVNGIDADVDFNVVNGSLLVLSELCL